MATQISNPGPALILRKRQLAQLLGIGTATLDRMRARGDFPAPIKLSEKAVGWPMATIQAWIDSRATAHHFVESLAF